MNSEVIRVEYILETRQLTKKFGKEIAVDKVDMKIREGEIYGFLGPNGAGKTTTIRMLLGLMRPSSGEVHIFQRDMRKHKLNILKKVGALVENPSYYPHLTAYENLEAIRKIVGCEKSRIYEVLDIVRLTEAAHKKVKGFSLGMKQRLGIAAALLNEPELLILDEPTNGLDPSGIIEMRNLIKSLPEKYGMTVLISSHLLSEIDQIATTVGVVDKGKLIYQGPIESMRRYSQQKVRMRVDQGERAWRSLIAAGIKAEYEGNWLMLQEDEDEKIGAIVRTLVRDGLSVYRIEEEKRSLEDVFLQMTGKEGIA